MSDGHDEPTGPWWENRSHVGLISLLIVVLAFIGLLVYSGVGPLKEPSHESPAGAEAGH